MESPVLGAGGKKGKYFAKITKFPLSRVDKIFLLFSSVNIKIIGILIPSPRRVACK
jgi:hypothetical protein